MKRGFLVQVTGETQQRSIYLFFWQFAMHISIVKALKSPAGEINTKICLNVPSAAFPQTLSTVMPVNCAEI